MNFELNPTSPKEDTKDLKNIAKKIKASLSHLFKDTNIKEGENLYKYKVGIQLAIKTYSIEDSAFSNPKKQVIQYAIRLLNAHEVDSFIASIPELNLFVLAISDAWLSTNCIKEKKALLDILKLIIIQMKINQQNIYNKTIKDFLSHCISRITQSNPKITKDDLHSEYIKMITQYIEENKDDEETKKVLAILNDWGDESQLSKIRRKLGIVNKRLERPFNVVVLKKSAQQMMEDIQFVAFFMRRSGKNTVVFNNEYNNSNSFEHEYVHSQSDGLSYLYNGLLFHGINEALTEELTSHPKTYPNQRYFLNSFLKDHPNYEEIMYKAYIGDKKAKSKLFSLIVNDLGLIKFLIFARVASIDDPIRSKYTGESIYIKPDVALTILSKQK